MKKEFTLNKSFLVIFVSLMMLGCGKMNLFEKQVKIPAQNWYYDNVANFTFQIKDTAALYNIYVVIRHTDRYKYNNIWLQLGSQAPGDSMHFQKINLRLAHDQSGWEGTAMDDIIEVRKNISPGPVSFKSMGEYTFSVAQIMRENPLQYIMNVGIRIEKMAP